MRRHVVQRNVGHQAQVDRARCRPERLRLELAASMMEVQLLLVEGKGAPALAERHRRHAEDALGSAHLLRVRCWLRQKNADDVVEPLHLHRLCAHAIEAAACRSMSPRWSARTSGRSVAGKPRSSATSSVSATLPDKTR